MMCGWRTIPNDSATDSPIHIPGVKKPSGPGSESRSGRSARHPFPERQRSPEEAAGKNQGPGPHRHVHPQALDHVRPVHGLEPPGHQVSARHDHEEQRAHLEGNPVPRND